MLAIAFCVSTSSLLPSSRKETNESLLKTGQNLPKKVKLSKSVLAFRPLIDSLFSSSLLSCLSVCLPRYEIIMRVFSVLESPQDFLKQPLAFKAFTGNHNVNVLKRPLAVMDPNVNGGNCANDNGGNEGWKGGGHDAEGLRDGQEEVFDDVGECSSSCTVASSRIERDIASDVQTTTCHRSQTILSQAPSHIHQQCLQTCRPLSERRYGRRFLVSSPLEVPPEGSLLFSSRSP